MRVLVIEGTEKAARLIEDVLTQADFVVHKTLAAEEGVDLAKSSRLDPEVVVIGATALFTPVSIIRAMRRANVHAPILVLASRIATNAVEVLDAGADDYLTQPYEPPELVSRLRALGRRGAGLSSSVIRCGSIVLDSTLRRVRAGSRAVPLTKTEYRFLEILMTRKNALVTRDGLMAAIYASDDPPMDQILSIYASKLRKKLADAGAPGHLRTIWGSGYALMEDTSAEEMAA